MVCTHTILFNSQSNPRWLGTISPYRMHACMLSHFSHVWLFVTLWTVARQAPLFMGFSRQEYWSGLLCPSPGDFPDPGIEFASPMSPASIDGFPGNSAGKKKIHLQCRRPRFNSWVGKFPWRRDRLPIPIFLGFPGGSDGKESTSNAGDLGLIPGLGRSSGGGHGSPLQYSCLENPHGQRSLAGYGP